MIVIDILTRTLRIDNKEIVMKSQLLLNALIYLAESNGMVRTRQDIIKHCWDSKIVSQRNIDTRFCHLRKIINDPNPGEVLICVKSVGYKIDPTKIKLLNKNGSTPKTAHDGYVFIKYAKLKNEQVVILQNIKNVDDWIVIPKSEY